MFKSLLRGLGAGVIAYALYIMMWAMSSQVPAFSMKSVGVIAFFSTIAIVIALVDYYFKN